LEAAHEDEVKDPFLKVTFDDLLQGRKPEAEVESTPWRP
jgi:hypothetical protein